MTEQELEALEKKLDKEEREIIADLKSSRASFDHFEDYIQHLESHYIAAMLNWTACLDEIDALRTENEQLRQASKVGELL